MQDFKYLRKISVIFYVLILPFYGSTLLEFPYFWDFPNRLLHPAYTHFFIIETIVIFSIDGVGHVTV